MTQQEAFHQALFRIEKAETKKLPSINLNDLPIDRLPEPLQWLSWLASLFIRGCADLTDISPVARLQSLKNLDLYGCARVHDLLPLEGLASLRSLDLSFCLEIEDLSPLSALTSLEELHLHQCTRVIDLSPLAKLTSLKYLDLSCCTGVSNISPLATLTSLRQLNLDGCKRVASFVPLRPLLSTLEELSVFGCDFDEAFAYGKRFKENVLDRVSLYYETTDQTRDDLLWLLSLLEDLFHKLEAGYKQHVGKILTILSLSFLAYFIWIAWPPRLATSRFAAAQLDFFFNGHQNIRKSYLDYSKTVVELAFAVVVSGSVFATGVRNWVQKQLDSLTNRLNEILEREIITLNRVILGTNRATTQIFLWALEKPRRRVLESVFKIIYTLVVTTITSTVSLPNRIAYLILWTVLAKFPGGVFGLVALILFLVLTWIKILRLYIDVIPPP